MSVQVGLRNDLPGRLSFLGSLYRSAPMTRLFLLYLMIHGREGAGTAVINLPIVSGREGAGIVVIISVS